jgi:hypothetical protein
MAPRRNPALQTQRTTVARTCEACGSPFTAFAYDVARGRGRSCSKACNATFRRHRAGPGITPLAVRFWAKVDKNGPIPTHRPELGPCWLWTGSRLKAGYGKIRAVSPARVEWLAHRVSYEMHHGPIPPGWYVMHACDTPPCIRPDHLSAGPGTENMRDAQAKGRTAGFIAHRRVGAAHHKARLSEADVLAIRERHARGGVTYSAIARDYGVNDATISRVVRRLNRTSI